MSLTQTFRGTATIEFPSTVRIVNHVTDATPGTESSVALTTGTKQLLIRCRGQADIQFAFTVTESGTKFITIPARASYNVENINISGTLFLQSDKASQTVEILEWST